jgi:hypothetical protein
MKFSATIDIIGVNPYVPVPLNVLRSLFKQFGKEKGPIPVKGTIDGKQFQQTLVKFGGSWRLYVNGEMCKAASVGVGDTVDITLTFDSVSRVLPMHEALGKALGHSHERDVFQALPPHRKKEILRYLHALKTPEAVERNVALVMQYLSGKKQEGLHSWLRIPEEE